jgi:hypothetical protein
MLRRPALLSTLSLLLLSALAPPAASDGSGGDAGASPGTALPLAVGTWEGTMPGGDVYDWFVLDVPAGMSPDLAFQVTTPLDDYYDEVYLGLVAESGRVIASGQANRYDPTVVVQGGKGPGPMYVRVSAFTGYNDPRPFNYTLTLAYVSLPDLQVASLADETLPLALLGQDGVPATRHVATLTLSNGGDAPAYATGSLIARTITDGKTVTLGSYAVEIPAHGTKTFAYTWDSVGRVGDIELSTRANAATGETDLDNNAAKLWVHSYVGNVGAGATLLA